MCGLAMKPATMYPNTNGCLSRLKMRVVSPAHISMSARSIINGDNSDIFLAFSCQLGNLDDHIHGFFDGLNRHKFIASVEV